MYQTDPSGNYSGWKATVIGQNNQAGKSILKTDFKDGNSPTNSSVQENLKTAVKILMKTMDSAAPSPERIELSTLKRNANDELEHYTLTSDEVNKFIEELQKEEEAESKRADSSSGNI